MFEKTDSVFNTQSIPLNISYTLFKSQFPQTVLTNPLGLRPSSDVELFMCRTYC